MSRPRLVVDVQRGFSNDFTRHIPARIARRKQIHERWAAPTGRLIVGHCGLRYPGCPSTSRGGGVSKRPGDVTLNSPVPATSPISAAAP